MDVHAVFSPMGINSSARMEGGDQCRPMKGILQQRDLECRGVELVYGVQNSGLLGWTST